MVLLEWIDSAQSHPTPKIVAMVEEVYAQNGERAFDIACMEEHRAWYDRNTYEQGIWRRVREEIMRRERELGFTFSRVR